ncbi:MAG: transposase, partial [Natronospirillum sp.]
KSYFGYKDHINVDNKHKLIRCWEVTPANRHDGHLLNDLLDARNSSADVYADSAYRSVENEQKLLDREFRSQINRTKPRHKPMPKHIERGNLRKSKVRARVEHVCGGIKQGAAKQFIKSIGLPRATLRVGLKNMAYNIKRFKHLLRHVTPMHRTA